MKSYLFVMTHAPHSGADVHESLDMLLTVAAFDQAVDLLFLDDGVLQLHKGQHSKNADFKDTAAIFQALEIYDVKALHVEAESLQDRGLKAVDMLLPVIQVYRKNVNKLFHHYDVICAC